MEDSNTKALIKKALGYQQAGKLLEAQQVFESILTENRHQADALHGLGMIYAQQKNFKKAVEFLNQAIQQAPWVAEFHNNLANAYKAQGAVDQALTHYQQALRIKPNYPQALNNLGALYYKLGKFKTAAELFEKSLRINPQSVDTHYNAANCYIQQDRLLDAVPHYQAVLQSRPDHLGANHNLGITLCSLKQYQQAKPYLQASLQREPNNIDTLFHLGMIHSSLAEADNAQSCYEQVLALDPNHAASHHNLATVFLHQQQKDKALQHYQRALELQPDNKTAAHMVAALSGVAQEQGAPLEYTRALFDQYAYSYDQHVKQKLHYNVPALLREAITPYVEKSTSAWQVVDLGCGTGLCAPYFADVAAKLIGVDVSPGMIEVAKQRGGYDKLLTLDILTFLERYQDAFDLAIAADVIVYFGSLNELFNATARVLKPGGYFAFSIEETNEKTQDEQYHLTETGRYAHHPDYIHALCQSTGFKICQQQPVTIREQEQKPVEGRIYILQVEKL